MDINNTNMAFRLSKSIIDNKFYDKLEKIFENKIVKLLEQYYFSEWYSTVDLICKTPKSYIFSIENLFDGSINNLIERLPNKECFARLDNCSSKSEKSFKSSQEIYDSFISSDKTKNYMKDKKMLLIIQKWLPNIKSKFTCFFNDGNFRAISTDNNTLKYFSKIDNIITKLNNLLNDICFYCDYKDFTVDFCICEENNKIEIQLIDINKPIYMSSCLSLDKINLSVPHIREILLGKYRPDIIDYPIIL